MKRLKDLFNWYFSKKTLPYWCVLVIDCLILLGTSVVIFWAFYRTLALLKYFWTLMRVMLIYIAETVVFFRIFRTYAGILRYSSFVDLMRIGSAMACALFVAFIIHYPLSRTPISLFAHLTARALFMIYVIATAIMWLERMLIKAVYDTYFRTDSAKSVVIYGIRAGGIGLAKSIRGEKPMRFKLKGFISHDPSLQAKGTILMGEPVFDVDEKLTDELKERNVEAVLVAPGRIERFREDQALQDYILKSGAKIYFAQAAVEWDKDNLVGSPSLKEVKIEDLLPRDEIKLDLDSVARELSGKKVFISGAAGSIGSEIVRQVASFGPSEMMLVDSAETPQHDIRLMMRRDFPSVKASTIVASVSNAGRMEALFKEFQPDYVFHAAAYKHVPMMEDNPSESVQNNVYGTKVLADLAVKYGVKKFVMVSTDKAVNPTNVMGCSKRLCEIYVQSLNKAEEEGMVEGHTQFVTTRFGNVLGSNGSVIPIFERQIKEGGPVTVTHPDIIRYFMLIPEACKLVLEAAVKGEGGEIFVFDMGKPVKIADLARRMIELSGVPDMEIKFTGLREGEKLYEEVLDSKESTKPSFNDKIRIATVREYDYSVVSGQIDELITISREYDDLKTVAAMKRLVPEFVSNQSRFSVLDQEVVRGGD
ncbi:MAG: polysaccharide biosynthesis protein [Bacteroidales bacterium]|nr:polysaccharide biosynthesis protein [Bacteroidales bacterium]